MIATRSPDGRIVPQIGVPPVNLDDHQPEEQPAHVHSPFLGYGYPQHTHNIGSNNDGADFSGWKLIIVSSLVSVDTNVMVNTSMRRKSIILSRLNVPMLHHQNRMARRLVESNLFTIFSKQMLAGHKQMGLLTPIRTRSGIWTGSGNFLKFLKDLLRYP